MLVHVRVSVVLLALLLPTLTRAQAGGAFTGNGDPPPPRAPAAPPPSGRAPGPAVQAGGPAPDMARYYQQAAQLYRNAAMQCPPRAACYNANSDYYRCLAQSLGSGGGCAKPTCSLTSPPCDAGSVQSAPATASGGPAAFPSVQQSFSNLANVLTSIAAEREQREAIYRDRQMRQDAQAQGILPKWELFHAQKQAIEADPFYINEFQSSPEFKSCPASCIGADTEGMLYYLRNESGSAIGTVMQGTRLEDDARESQLQEAQIDAFQQFKLRWSLETAEREVRQVELATRTTQLSVTPVVIAQNLRSPRLLGTIGKPAWLSYADEAGTLSDAWALEGGAVRRLLPTGKIESAARDDRALFWVESGRVMRLTEGAEAPAQLSMSACASKLLLDDGYVYFTCMTDRNTSTAGIYRVAKTGGEPTLLVPPTAMLAISSISASTLYWSVWGTDQGSYEDGTLFMMDKAGGSPLALASPVKTPTCLIEGGDKRYWSADIAGRIEYTGAIYESVSGATKPILIDLDHPDNLTAVNGELYWTETRFPHTRQDGTYDGPFVSSIKRIALDTGKITILAEGLRGTTSFTIDGDTLFYTESGTQSYQPSTNSTAYHQDGAVFSMSLPARPRAIQAKPTRERLQPPRHPKKAAPHAP